MRRKAEAPSTSFQWSSRPLRSQEGHYLKATRRDDQHNRGYTRKNRHAPARVLSVAQPPVEESQPGPKRARINFRPILSFSEEDKIGTIQPHNDALLITFRIGNCDVKKVMVDGSSAAEVMYPDLYKGLRLKPKDLMPYNSPLISFDGKLVIPMGMIRLPI